MIMQNQVSKCLVHELKQCFPANRNNLVSYDSVQYKYSSVSWSDTLTPACLDEMEKNEMKKKKNQECFNIFPSLEIDVP